MSTDQAKALNALLKKIKGTTLLDEPERSPMDEFVFTFLLWDSTTPRATRAFDRLMSHVVDVNELRVCRPPELVAVIGTDYPRAEERLILLCDALHQIYLREHEVSLDNAMALGKRDGRKYFDTIESLPQFVAARVMLRCMGAHAVPLDERLLTLLTDADVFPEPLDFDKAVTFLERHVKAADSADVHALLQAWSEENATRSGKAATKKKTRKTSRKKTSRKTTKKGTSRASTGEKSRKKTSRTAKK